MKIAVIGAGYVGLVTATCLAAWGHEVACVDNNAAKIDLLLQGGVPIYEPGLGDLIAASVASGNLSFCTNLAAAVADAAGVFIAVGTPPNPSTGEADLSFVYLAARELAAVLREGAVVVVKSTVPVGTGDVVERLISAVRPAGSYAVVSNPEFLREGSAIADFQRPDRVVIGAEDAAARQLMGDIYAPIADRVPLVFTDRRTSELIKYAANAFLATKITFINEMADLCERTGADIGDLAHGIGLDHRIGPSFLSAGPGYGGSCFPKDTLALMRTAQDFGVPLRVVEQSIAANDARKRRMARKVIEAMGGAVDGSRIAILGLSFKPDTDDMREAPSIPLIEMLQKSGASIAAHDPVAMPRAAEILTGVSFFDDPYACAAGADAVVVVTEWAAFRALDLGRLRRAMSGTVIVDLRNLIAAGAAASNGLRLTNLGRTLSHPDEAAAVPPPFDAPDGSADGAASGRKQHVR